MFRGLFTALFALCVGLSAGAQELSTGSLLDRIQGGGVLLKFVLMDQTSVQQELRATPEQVQAVRQAGDRQRAQLEGLAQLPKVEAAERVLKVQASADADLKRILSPEQHQRLTQIALQQAGPLLGLSRPDVAESVALSVEQKASLTRMREDLVTQAANAAQGAGGLRRGGLLANIERLKAAKQQADANALALLRPEQTAQWQQLQGTPFRGQLQLGPLSNMPADRPFLQRFR